MKNLLVISVTLLMTITAGFCADTRFVQIDGVNFSYKNEKSIENFNTLINKVNKVENVDFVVFSGNNIDNPERKNLEGFLKSAKKLKNPFYVVIGHKDVNKRKDFGKKEYVKILRFKNLSHLKIASPNYVFEKNGNIFIVVDGSKDVIPSANGYYKPDVLEWLESKLNKYSDKNVFIIQHFPLTMTGAKDSNFTYKPEEYLKLLAKHKNVKGLFAGNYNVNTEENINGVVHITTANAPCYKIVDIINSDTNEPTIWAVTAK